MMRSDTLKWHDYGGYTKITDPSSNIICTDEEESKRIILNKNLLQNFPRQGQIKTKHHQQNFIVEKSRGVRQTMFNRERKIRVPKCA